MVQSNDGCTDEQYNGISVNACRCNTDYCNTAANIHISMATAIVSLVTMIYLIFRWHFDCILANYKYLLANEYINFALKKLNMSDKNIPDRANFWLANAARAVGFRGH